VRLAYVEYTQNQFTWGSVFILQFAFLVVMLEYFLFAQNGTAGQGYYSTVAASGRFQPCLALRGAVDGIMAQ
jgi:hypothetical protein